MTRIRMIKSIYTEESSSNPKDSSIASFLIEDTPEHRGSKFANTDKREDLGVMGENPKGRKNHSLAGKTDRSDELSPDLLVQPYPTP